MEALVSAGCPELIVGEVSKLVDAKPEFAVACRVERLDELGVGLEHLEPLSLLNVVRVNTVVLGHPLLVLRRHGLVIITQLTSCKDGTEKAGTTEDSKKQSLRGGHDQSALTNNYSAAA